MIKKIVCTLIAVCMLSCSALAVEAETLPVYDEPDGARFEQIIVMTAGLTISDTGYATCSGSVFLRPGYNVRATIALSGLFWDFYQTCPFMDSYRFRPRGCQ